MPNLKLSPKQLMFIGGGVLLLILIFVFASLGNRSKDKPPSVSLTAWGTEPKEFFSAGLALYKQARPNVTVDYVQKDPAVYESQLLDALASGNGPDLYSISNRALGRELNRLYPADPAQYAPGQLQAAFADAISQDFVSGGKVYALPLYLDTLALLYSRDAFNQAALVSPPASWTDFENFIPLLRKLDMNGQIITPGAGMGGSTESVTYAPDILSAIFLQNGISVANASGADFASEAGLTAFNFYLQFANPQSGTYAWNDGQGLDSSLFASGRLAMMFGYRSDAAGIRARSPFFNFGVAPFPQIAGGKPMAFPSYQGFAIAKQSKNPSWAWDFAIYFTTYPDVIKTYLAASRRPPALRSLIGANVNDPELGVFARQALIARSWYEKNPVSAENIFNSAIKNVLSGRNDSRTALQQASDQMTALLRGTP